MRYEANLELNISKELKFNNGTRIVYRLSRIEKGYQMSIEETTNPHFPNSVKTGDYIIFKDVGDNFDFGNDSLFLVN
ncbi:hypothetical protein [Enterococcus gilvus]|uniref:hypothetical protein n=1 Tax=Enterococcus gilvus TaxID=160453 RepID=UPI0028D8F467|nr:hypothetical protein [Enterococcus gilvus]